ncbi:MULTISPECIES: ATP synthase subunit I [Bacillaceae]|uniref:ATP synthase subunit I n=1 Tax=Sutcliffiella horikoshii TaxID=79883 RepID=A0A5D4T300_9BACI|nr:MULTISPECIES: ATP synthase subunit I [Bacillaceae]TYS70060.1 ATP synthase subunit I [Sutcliffiella horikoshii]
MPESTKQFMRHMKYFLFLLAFFVIGWGFTSYQEWFLGLILGTVISIYSHWLLHKKVKKFTEAVAEGRKAVTLGSFSRMAAAVLGVVIAMRYPETLSLYGVIIGIMTSYIVIIIDSFVTLFKAVGKRGE